MGAVTELPIVKRIGVKNGRSEKGEGKDSFGSLDARNFVAGKSGLGRVGVGNDVGTLWIMKVPKSLWREE